MGQYGRPLLAVLGPFLLHERGNPALERVGDGAESLARPHAFQDPVHERRVRRDSDPLFLRVRTVTGARHMVGERNADLTVSRNKSLRAAWHRLALRGQDGLIPPGHQAVMCLRCPCYLFGPSPPSPL